MELLDNLVVLTGIPKSGTSLLMDLLDGHPNYLLYPGEPYFRVLMFRKYEDAFHMLADWLCEQSYVMTLKPEFRSLVEGKRSRYSRAIDREILKPLIDRLENGRISDVIERAKIFSQEQNPWEKMNFDLFRDEFYDSFLRNLGSASECTILIRAVFQGLYSSLDPEIRGKARMCLFKDPGFFNFDLLKRDFPKAKCLFIARDLRGTFNSALRSFQKQKGKYMSRWNLRRFLFALNAGKTIFFPEKFFRIRHSGFENDIHVVKYEDCVLNTETTMRSIAQFLESDYDEILTVPTKFGIPVTTGTATSAGRGEVSARSVEAWKKELNPFEKFYFQQLMAAVPDYADLYLPPSPFHCIPRLLLQPLIRCLSCSLAVARGN
ncbi:MAG: sulfotransferase [Candidatus Hydrogenedentota bacterium]|nr:MAG: sulfotransferase [Candidatus Hydrogenedentota bacterium]